MSSSDLACKSFVELVTDYLEQALPPGERSRYEAHLKACRHCQRYLEQMQQAVRALSALVDEAFSPEERERFVERFRQWRSTDAQLGTLDAPVGGA